MKLATSSPAPASEFALADLNNALDPQEVDLTVVIRYFKKFNHELAVQGALEDVGENHDYLRTWRLHAPDVWQQCAVVVFPYKHDTWSRLIFDCFRKEGDHWRSWCSAEDKRPRVTQRFEIASLWSGLDTLTDRAGTFFMGEHAIGGFPVLVRPYLPWPTLEERPLPGGVRTAVMSSIPTIAPQGWNDATIISDGTRALPLWWSLADRTLPTVVAQVLTNSRDVAGVKP